MNVNMKKKKKTLYLYQTCLEARIKDETILDDFMTVKTLKKDLHFRRIS